MRAFERCAACPGREAGAFFAHLACAERIAGDLYNRPIITITLREVEESMPIPTGWRRALALAMLLLLPAGVGAHGNDGDGQGAQPMLLDCDALPQDALRALPAPVDRWTAIQCLPNGQSLHQKQGWTWRFPGSFTTQVIIPAGTTSPPEHAFGRYFARIDLSVQEGEEAARMHAELARKVPTYRFHFGERLGETRPEAVYTLRVHDDKDGEFTIVMAYRSDQDIWGLVCMPDCVPESLFMVTRVQQ
jgi:hypothetical protein